MQQTPMAQTAAPTPDRITLNEWRQVYVRGGDALIHEDGTEFTVVGGDGRGGFEPIVHGPRARFHSRWMRGGYRYVAVDEWGDGEWRVYPVHEFPAFRPTSRHAASLAWLYEVERRQAAVVA